MRHRWDRHRVAIGLAGAILLLVGTATYQALITPPYRFIDEQAHAGYVLELQAGRLPTIDTPIDQARGGVALRTRLADEPERRRDVWVANNPPLTYLVAAGPSALTRALGVPGGPLLGLRLVNLAAVAGAVACSYLLARDLSRGDRTVGLVAAGLVAALPHVGFVASLGFNDGTSLLATTGVLLWLARVAGAGPASSGERRWTELRAVQWLGLWCALAALTRPMALAVAVVALGLGWVAVAWRRSAALGPATAWLAGPTLVLGSWWYLRNWSTYGDLTGSDALFEKFGRQPTGSLVSSLTTRGVWETVVRTLTTRRIEQPLPGDPRWWYQVALVVLVAGVVATAVLVVRSVLAGRARRDGRAGDAARALPGLAWLTSAIVAFVPVVLTAQHRAGGGAPHPRYLLPAVPVVAAAVALASVRLLTRWAGALLVAALATAMLLQTRAAARWLAANPKGPAGSELVTAYASEPVRALALAVGLAGLVLVIAAIAAPAPPAVAGSTDLGEGPELPAGEVPEGAVVAGRVDVELDRPVVEGDDPDAGLLEPDR